MHARKRSSMFLIQLIALFLAQASAAHAGNMSFVSDAPIGRFSEEDMRLMNANIEAALADPKVRAVHAWSNPSTKHSGTAETLQAFSGPNGIPCKRMQVANRAGNLNGKGQYTLCKLDGQGWTYVPKEYATPEQSKSGKKP